MVEGAYTNSEGVIVDEKYVAYVAIPGTVKSFFSERMPPKSNTFWGPQDVRFRILADKVRKVIARNAAVRRAGP
jgi:hypothetical protein